MSTSSHWQLAREDNTFTRLLVLQVCLLHVWLPKNSPRCQPLKDNFSASRGNGYHFHNTPSRHITGSTPLSISAYRLLQPSMLGTDAKKKPQEIREQSAHGCDTCPLIRRERHPPRQGPLTRLGFSADSPVRNFALPFCVDSYCCSII